MAHLDIPKTYKLFIDGQFPRTESGRSFLVNSADGSAIANLCQASRKDFRNAVAAARKAQVGWADRAAFNRSQILYRLAEMLDGRLEQFVKELNSQGISTGDAEKEVCASVDRLVYYAGWCDKYQQVSGTVNPVASSHFNFSVPEPMGVVGILAPDAYGLLGFVSLVAPVIAGGNTCVVLASESKPLCRGCGNL
jgi:acyl-CoA reductase-like NAD-dependent aldehyde dehydrogenase